MRILAPDAVVRDHWVEVDKRRRGSIWSASNVDHLRKLGVPVQMQRRSKDAADGYRHFAPRWAVQLVNDWPLNDKEDDYDHSTLKLTIRHALELDAFKEGTGGEFAMAAVAAAHLSGEDAVKVMIWGPPSDVPGLQR